MQIHRFKPCAGCQGLGVGGWGVSVNGYRVSSWGLELDRGGGRTTTANALNAVELSTLKWLDFVHLTSIEKKIIIQTQKDEYCDSTFMRYLKWSNSEAESRMMAAWGWEDGELVFHGCRVSVWEERKFWRRMVMTVAQQVNVLSTAHLKTVKMVKLHLLCILPQFKKS